MTNNKAYILIISIVFFNCFNVTSQTSVQYGFECGLNRHYNITHDETVKSWRHWKIKPTGLKVGFSAAIAKNRIRYSLPLAFNYYSIRIDTSGALQQGGGGGSLLYNISNRVNLAVPLTIGYNLLKSASNKLYLNVAIGPEFKVYNHSVDYPIGSNVIVYENRYLDLDFTNFLFQLNLEYLIQLKNNQSLSVVLCGDKQFYGRIIWDRLSFGLKYMFGKSE